MPSGPVTLASQAKANKNDLLTNGMIMSMLKVHPWFTSTFPFITNDRLDAKGLRTDTLPSVGFRNLSEAFSVTHGTMETFSENLYSLGSLTDVDHLLEDEGGLVQRPRALQQKLKAESMIRTFADTFVNGDRGVAAYAKAFDGVKVRIGQLGSEQSLNASTLDISTAANRAGGNGAALLYQMRTAYYRVARVCGRVDAILMNDTAFLAVQDVLSLQGVLRTTTDAYDREIKTFMGAELVDVGFKSDLSTRIITDTHDGDSINTSMYFLAVGDDYLNGVQRAPLKAEDLGRTPDGVFYRTHVEWVVTLMGFNEFWGCRLRGIKVV